MSDNVVNLEDKRRSLKDAEDDDALLMVIVRADGRVTTWVADRVETSEQWGWLYSQLAAATHELVQMEGSITPLPSAS